MKPILAGLMSLWVGAACGEVLDAGGDAPDSRGGAASDNPNPVSTVVRPQLLKNLGDPSSIESIAMARNELYVQATSNSRTGLFRCSKGDCNDTWTYLQGTAPGGTHLGVSNDHLGMVTLADTEKLIRSCVLPGCSGAETVIGDIPAREEGAPLFHGGFVYWFLLADRTLYRCNLPACESGATTVFTGRELSADQIIADDQYVYWRSLSRVLRVAHSGDGTVEAVVLGETLRAASPTQAPEQPTDAIWSMALDGGYLYVATHDSACDSSDCTGSIWRWSTSGQERRQLMIQPSGQVADMRVTDGEIVWTVPRADGGADLERCRAENCTTTRRTFGQSATTELLFSSDESNLYWAEKNVRSAQLLTIPRLPRTK